jgi:hypothetical protein
LTIARYCRDNRPASKRLLKMLERKRVESNCQRMVQGNFGSTYFCRYQNCFIIIFYYFVLHFPLLNLSLLYVFVQSPRVCRHRCIANADHTEASALVTKILVVNAGLETELQVCFHRVEYMSHVICFARDCFRSRRRNC